MIDNKIVVFFKESKNNGCNFYRILQPAMKLAEKGRIIAAPSSQLQNDQEREIWFEQADIVVTQQTSEPLLEVMKENRTKKRFVIDWDDNIFDVSPYNPAYESCGYKDVEVTLSGQRRFLWKDGEQGFSVAKNRERLQTFAKCLSLASLVTCPSPILSGKFKQLNKSTKVIKNFLDFSVWQPLELPKTDKIRIGWQGGHSHFEDWHVVKEAMKIILDKNKNVELVIMGSHFLGATKEFNLSQVKTEPWVDIMAYPHKFKTLNLDIGIAPLKNDLFNTAKSELKWTEYSALGIPAVCSNIPPYMLNVRDGETGFLCGSVEEWVIVLQKLINDKELRQRIGKQAMKHVREHYDIEKNIEEYENLYLSLTGMRKELILN